VKILLLPKNTGTGAGRLGKVDSRTQQVILYTLSALADLIDPIHDPLPGSCGDTANATSHWECQDSWSSILKVHRAMALTLLSPKAQLLGFQVIRNLTLRRL